MGVKKALGTGLARPAAERFRRRDDFRYCSAMHFLTALASMLLIFLVLFDAFETMVLPRRVTHRFRLTRFYFRASWVCWRRAVSLFRLPRQRLAFLSLFGPLSVLGLFCFWVAILIPAFGLLHWSFRTALAGLPAPGIETYLYLSGVTFFTLGYGDVVPAESLGRRSPWEKPGSALGSWL